MEWCLHTGNQNSVCARAHHCMHMLSNNMHALQGIQVACLTACRCGQ